MSQAHKRKKAPEAVRAALLDAAGRIVLEQGLGAASVQAIASAAGVTKGAFFHHYASRAALFEALHQGVLDAFEAALNARMAADPDPHGRFSRAYLDLSLTSDEDGPEGDDPSPLWMALMADADLRDAWSRWLGAQIARHQASEPPLAAEILRFAADGIWLNNFSGKRPADPRALRAALIALLGDPHVA